MPELPLAVVVLAAGEGTRMKSANRAKVLHGFAGRTMLGHVLAAAGPLGAAHTLVVVGHRRDDVTAHLHDIAPEAVAVVQEQQHGTGHAARLALDALPADAAATLLTCELPDPTGYGRVIRDRDGTPTRIVEQRDADPEELAITEVATSVYAFDQHALRDALGRLSVGNAQGEEYLTDVVAILAAAGRRLATVTAPAATTAGVNDRVQLAAAHRIYNTRLLEAHMRAGVTVVDPATTWLDADVTIEPDATLWPSLDLHGATHIGGGAEIGPQVSLTDTSVGAGARISRTVAIQAQIGAGATIGPFAYLRPGTVLADEVHVGTYVELKKADVGEGTKIPHLTYVGDATIGEHTNIGAASVFVNYDGVAKHHTVVGSHARTGADNMFVAPVRVGDGAYTAAGSVITQDVPPGALGVGRAAQRNVAGWVARKRPGTPAAEAAARALENERALEDEKEQG